MSLDIQIRKVEHINIYQRCGNKKRSDAKHAHSSGHVMKHAQVSFRNFECKKKKRSGAIISPKYVRGVKAQVNLHDR